MTLLFLFAQWKRKLCDTLLVQLNVSEQNLHGLRFSMAMSKMQNGMLLVQPLALLITFVTIRKCIIKYGIHPLCLFFKGS